MKQFFRIGLSAVAIACLFAGAATAEDTPAASASPAPDATKPMAVSKSMKKKPTKLTRRQEIDRSIDEGTVPNRYRNSVPQEYQQYVPFDKR